MHINFLSVGGTKFVYAYMQTGPYVCKDFSVPVYST